MAISTIIPDIRQSSERVGLDRALEKNTISECGDSCRYCCSCEYQKLDSRERINTRQNCQYFTRCQIRRHNTMNSAWLVAGDKIYDATKYLNQHPGGEASILKKAGGACDCTEDLKFHSKRGRKEWDKYFVGKVKPCPGSPDETRNWWMFWM